MEKGENPQGEIQKEEKPTMMGGLKSIGIALVFFAVAYYFYTTMSSYESGESVRMNSLLLIAYKLLGKNITAGILGLFGLLIGYGGIKEIMQAQ